ncbi:MAG: phosphate ABC transporter permease PstA [Verrucomicrobiales bacterium]|nr:phosphate ABC transporter permease PstA [Verrucomicrobiales bacterium]
MSKFSQKIGGSKRERSAPGEPMVWFSGMWLAIGILMIVFLLSVIVVNGLGVFWPKAVVQVELTEASEAGWKQSQYFAGELHKTQVRRVGSADGEAIPEIQLFVGNRDVYGFGFKFIDEHDVLQRTFPKGILLVERMEYGDLIAFPVKLQLADGKVIEAGDQGFDEELQRAVQRASDRRHEITHLERGEIGRVNQKMERLKMRLKKTELKGGNVKQVAAETKLEQDELQERYEKMAAEAAGLRARQKEETFHYRLVTGEQGSLELGGVVCFYYPNQLSTWTKLGHFFSSIWGFLSEEPREANTEGGVFPALFGTFVMTLIMCILVVPIGVVAAIYLQEYAKQGLVVRLVRIAVNNLAGVPSIVYGVFGLGFFVYMMGGSIDSLFYPERLPTPTFGTGGLLWASLTMALMTVPVVIVSTEEALASVTRGMREASLAAGASKWQTIQHIVLPGGLPGIITGMILAMARGAGEVAPLMLVGVVKLAPTLPLDTIAPYMHLERKFMHLGFHIYDLGFQSPDSEAAKPMVFATTLLLIALVVVLNAAAIIVREKLRKKYSSGAF